MTTSVRAISSVGTSPTQQIFGIYQGSVININDPLIQGRVQAFVPQVLGTAYSNWAIPLGTPDVRVGQAIFVMFIGGDRNQPVYIPIGSSGNGLAPSKDTSGNTDTNAIQALIKLGASTIPLDTGTFYISSTGISLASGVRLTGQGYLATTVQSAGSGPIFIMDTGTQLDNVEIDHMTLQASAGQPIFSGMYITRSEVHDCYLNAASGSASSSIWYSNAGVGYMAECRFYQNREQIYATGRTVPAWYLNANNTGTLFQVNDNHWHDNVCFNNNKDTNQYHYQLVYSGGFAGVTNNANTFEDIVFEFPTGGMIWMDSASYTTINRCTNEDLSSSTVGNPLIKFTQNAGGGIPQLNKIRNYSRRSGGFSGIIDIQLTSACTGTIIDSPSQSGGGTALTIDLGTSSAIDISGLQPSTKINNTGSYITKWVQALYKPNNTTRSGTSVTSDPDLQSVTIAANGVYVIEVVLGVSGTSTGNIQYQFAIPSGAAGSYVVEQYSVGANFQFYNSPTWTQNNTASTTAAGANGIEIRGILDNTGNASGSFSFQWGQNTNNGNTTVGQYSYMKLERIR